MEFHKGGRMITLIVDGEPMQFKNYRQAHYDLDCYSFCKGTYCTARTLDHYSDFEITHDDFGVEIGKECVEEMLDYEERKRMKKEVKK